MSRKLNDAITTVRNKGGQHESPVTDVPTAELVDTRGDVDPVQVGLTLFSSHASGDIERYDAQQFQLELKTGFTMVERYLSMEPGDRARCWLLGWSAALIPDLQRPGGLRYIRKLHLELRSGARVSLLDAAQLAGLFLLPMDGSTEVVIIRGDKEELDNGRQMGNWGCAYTLAARSPTHENNQSYAAVTGHATLHQRFETMRYDELGAISGVPAKLIEPYVQAAREREIQAEADRRRAQYAPTMPTA